MGATILPFPVHRRAPRESVGEAIERLAVLLELVDEAAHKVADLLELEAEEQERQHLRDQDASGGQD